MITSKVFENEAELNEFVAKNKVEIVSIETIKRELEMKTKYITVEIIPPIFKEIIKLWYKTIS